MSEEQKDIPVSRLLDNAENLKTITITAKDGKDYILEAKIPSAVFRFVNSNAQLLRRLLPINEDGLDFELQQRAEKVLNKIISIANKGKYPELTPNYIEANFEPADFTIINMMYITEWAKIITANTSEATPPKE